MPWSVVNFNPLRLNLVAILLNPIFPSLNIEFRYISGYAFRSSPSAFSGTLLYTFEILNPDNCDTLILLFSFLKVSLAFSTTWYVISFFTISYPLTYAFPGPIPATINPLASSASMPFTKFVSGSNAYVPLLSSLK